MKSKLLKNAGIVLACSLLAKLLSYVYEATLAALLGTGVEADALYMSISVFNILYPILDLGIWKVFLPSYKARLSEGREEKANQIANNAITFFLLISLALVLFLLVFARQIAAVMAPGFDPAKRALTIEYLRLTAPSYLLMSMASILGAMLQSHDRFLGSQLREIGTHSSKIVFVFLCFRHLGPLAAVAAMTVGSVFRVLIQLPFINWSWRYRPELQTKDPEVKMMLKGLPSVAVTSMVLHINSLIDKMVASSAQGAVSGLNYGYRLMSVFSGTISTALSTATYPEMVDCIARREEDRLRGLLVRILQLLSFFILPITLFCMVFSTEIVTVAFQRGAFDASATSLTAQVFLGYCLGMLSSACSNILANVFYGYGDTKTSMYVSILNILLNICLDLLFFHLVGVAGLAYATSLSSILCLLLRALLMRKYLRMSYGEVFGEGLKILALSGLCVAAAWLLFKRIFALGVMLRLALSLLLCLVLFLALASLFRVKTLREAKSLLKKRLKRKKT